MKRRLQTAGALVLLLATAATAVSADSVQLVASAGMNPADAANASMTEIATAKFNADTRRDDRIVVASQAVAADPFAHAQLFAAAGITPVEGLDLRDLAVAKRNRETRGDDVTRRYSPGATNNHAQLMASIGVAPEIGRSVDLNAIYLEEIVRRSND